MAGGASCHLLSPSWREVQLGCSGVWECLGQAAVRCWQQEPSRAGPAAPASPWAPEGRAPPMAPLRRRPRAPPPPPYWRRGRRGSAQNGGGRARAALGLWGGGGASVELCNASGSPSDSLKRETVLPTKGSLGGLGAALPSPAGGVLQNGVCSGAVSAEREAASFGWSRVEVTLRDCLCTRLLLERVPITHTRPKNNFVQ